MQGLDNFPKLKYGMYEKASGIGPQGVESVQFPFCSGQMCFMECSVSRHGLEEQEKVISLKLDSHHYSKPGGSLKIPFS